MLTNLAQTIHGTNGSPGLARNVIKLETELSTLNKLLTNDIQHICEDIREIKNDISDIKKEDKDKDKDESVVKWPYLMDKFFAPVLTAIIIAVILYFVIPR